MIIHYLRIALKAFGKYKYHTFINIFGLVSGMLGALIIAKYIGGSLQFDSFHTNRKQVHSVSQRESIAGGDQQERATTYQGVADLIAQFPEVRQTTRYMYHVESLVIANAGNDRQESFTEERIFMSDSCFFRMFSFSFLHGNPETALSPANSVVLTRSTAKKYFKDEDPLGKTILIRTSWGQELSYEITGVIEDIPLLSRFRFDILVNAPAVIPEELWNLPDYSIHVLLHNNANAADLAQKVTAQLRAVPELKSANKNVILSVRSISDVQLSDTEYLLVAIGIMIAIICWVNYINQSIAQAYWRTKQVGILKVFGATKGNLRAQFAVESALVSFIALAAVFGVYIGIENWLQFITDGHMLPLIGDPTLINLIFILIFAVGMSLGAFAPTVILLSQNLEKTLRSNFIPQIGGITMRKLFVVVQFSISTVMLVGIFVISGQLDYLQNKDKGISMEGVLVIKDPLSKGKRIEKMKILELFKDQAAALPVVKVISSSTTVPGEEYRHEAYLSLQGHDEKVLVHQSGVDENFFSLYEVPFVAGLDFIPNALAKNRESIILNESAARALGFTDMTKLLNTQITDHQNPEDVYFVVGVVKDFNQTSLKYKVRPLAFKYNIFRGHFSIRLDEARLNQGTFEEALASLKTLWKESYPDSAFDYYFLNEKFRAQDQEDQYFSSLFRAFTILSVILSCLGLFGLSILISTKRQKEVGVRKTFGATSFDILTLFVRGYVGPLAIALIIGAGSSYFMMREWLTSYANRIEIGPGLMLSAIVTLIAIFIVTVSYHTAKAASTNPITVLRD